jgi:hypothetical protein
LNPAKYLDGASHRTKHYKPNHVPGEFLGVDDTNDVTSQPYRQQAEQSETNGSAKEND